MGSAYRSVGLQVEVDAVLSTAVPAAAVASEAGHLMRRDDVHFAANEMLIFPAHAIAAAQAVFNVQRQVRILRSRKGIAMDACAAR